MSSAPKIPILVVDDYPGNLIAMGALLDRGDYEVIEVASGEQALAVALGREIAVVILDVQMPKMDGYEVANRLRADPRTHGVPIIFITALLLEESETHGGSLRGEDYFGKPFDADALLAKIAAYAARYRQGTSRR